jgi:large subunit ribosomal protein L15
MKVNELFNVPGSRKPRRRVGRGIGSGMGKTCGRGEKGQKSRSGVAIKSEGGQMPLIKRLPKRGFNCSKGIDYTVINLADIEFLVSEKRIDEKATIDKEQLVKVGYIKTIKVPVKLLGGEDKTEHKLTFKLDAYSKSVREVVEQAGGKLL